MEKTLPQPGLRERRFAAIAHASIITYILGMATGPFWLCFLFPIIPFIILVSFNRKDKWVSFHAWQALIYQTTLSFVFLLIGFPVFISIFAKCAPGFGQNSSGCNEAFLPLILATVVFLIIIPLGLVVFGFIKGILLLSGKDIEYPLISRILQKWLKFQEQ